MSATKFGCFAYFPYISLEQDDIKDDDISKFPQCTVLCRHALPG